MKLTKIMAAAVGVGLVAAGLLTAGPASADPTDATGTPPTSARPLQGVGSDTTQNVMNALSEVITIGGNRQIASWNAGTSTTETYQTRTTDADCVYTRSQGNGSSAGRSRLVESLTAGNAKEGCLDFARSSSPKGSFVSPTVATSVTWIPFANDSSTFVVRADSPLIGRDYTLDFIKDIYKCVYWPNVAPVLPQTDSGSRAFWLTTMQITEAQITSGSYSAGPPADPANPSGPKVNCLKPVSAGGQGRPYVQENNAVTLKTDEIMPFSVGLWNTQALGINEDFRGLSTLGRIDSVAPIQGTLGFPVQRDLYNLVPTSKLATAPTSTVFVGSGSLVCTNGATIQAQGFNQVANCGDTSVNSTPVTP